MENCPNAPHGNFWALLGFRVSAGDSVLRDHLAKAHANAKYTSPSIQNEVADILGTQIKRNIERIDTLQRFKDLFSSVVSCFESISAEGSGSWSSDSLTDASTLLTAITTTDFVSALVITSNSLNCLKPLPTSLQSESKDIVEAVQKIDSLERILTEKRQNVDSIHSEWFEEIDKMCRSIRVEPSLPRLCGRQRNRDNIPAQTPSQYYRRTVTIPVLDHLISEMNRRFSEHQKTAFLGLNLILSILVKKPLCEVESVLLPLESTYTSDLQDDSFKPELHQWYLKWKKEDDTCGIQALPNTLAFTLPHCSSYFANIQILLHILYTHFQSPPAHLRDLLVH